MTDYIPPYIKEVVDDLESKTGHRPTVTAITNRQWRLTMTNERVHMTVDYKTTSPGRWRWAGSRLVVDGERRRVASSREHFTKIFLDPDHSDQPEEVESAPEHVEPEPMPQARPVSEAPSRVQHSYRILERALSDKGELQLGADDVQWVIEATFGAAVLRLRYREHRKKWNLAKRDGIQLIIDNVDRSAEVRGGLEAAIKMLAGQGGRPNATKPAINSTSGPARSNSVETRRATVTRT